ncbi:hypothetical protein RYX36_006383 [Vicia faba]
MSSRSGLNKRSRTSAGSSSGTRPSVVPMEFDNMLMGPLQQARFSELVKRKILAEKIFTLNLHGDYRDIMQNLENRAQVILQEMRVITVSGHPLGTKVPPTLAFSGLLWGCVGKQVQMGYDGGVEEGIHVHS